MFTKDEKMKSISKKVKTAGILYLLVIIFGMFAELYVSLNLVVPGNATLTANNIRGSEMLFRIGFMSGLFHHTCFLLLVLALFRLLRPVNSIVAWLMLFLGLGSVPIMMLNMINQFAPLILFSGADYLKVFNAEHLEALALVFLEFHTIGYLIAGVFSGLFLLPLGYLVYQSGFFPRILGYLLVLGGLGYMTELFVYFVIPSFEIIAFIGLALAIIAELSLTFWLLFGKVFERGKPVSTT
jgi:hypothetical protein